MAMSKNVSRYSEKRERKEGKTSRTPSRQSGQRKELTGEPDKKAGTLGVVVVAAPFTFVSPLQTESWANPFSHTGCVCHWQLNLFCRSPSDSPALLLPRLNNNWMRVVQCANPDGKFQRFSWLGDWLNKYNNKIFFQNDKARKLLSQIYYAAYRRMMNLLWIFVAALPNWVFFSIEII